MRGKKTRILLANNQNMVRQGVRQLLEREEDFEVIGETDNALDAVSLVDELKPDVVIMEARMPKLSVVEVIKRVKKRFPQTAILILTMCDEEEQIAELLIAGAAGYLLKTAYSKELVQAIRSVRAGEFVCSIELMQRLMKYTARPQPVALDYGEHLTPRETEVLRLAARGMSNRKIATHLNVSERTVKGHLSNIFQKMNIGSRTEAVLEAIKRDWISLEKNR